jgi:CARDB
MRIQRIVIAAVVVFLVIFGAALWLRSCQHSRKVSTYRTYFEQVSLAIKDSDAIGKKLNKFLQNPTKLQRPQLTAALKSWTADQQEIAVRADRLDTPDPLADEQAQFATGMAVRANGFALLEQGVLNALGKKRQAANLARITALGGYFSGPDAYYMQLVYLQSRQTLKDQGVTDVTVPTSTYYLTAKLFDAARIESALSRIGDSAKLGDTHGVALAGVNAVSGGKTVKLVAGSTVDVTASADLAFTVSVQNQGTIAEADVPVTITLVLPDNSTLKETGAIAAIAAGKTQSVSITGFAIPTDALSKVVTLKVKAGPVAQERSESNNSGQYKFTLQLQ